MEEQNGKGPTIIGSIIIGLAILISLFAFGRVTIGMAGVGLIALGIGQLQKDLYIWGIALFLLGGIALLGAMFAVIPGIP